MVRLYCHVGGGEVKLPENPHSNSHTYACIKPQALPQYLLHIESLSQEGVPQNAMSSVLSGYMWVIILTFHTKQLLQKLISV